MKYADAKCTYSRNEDGDYVFTGKCVVTGDTITVTVPKQELYNYRLGFRIQDAMPSLSKGEREFLMSGISDKGWAMTFPAGPNINKGNSE